MSAKHDPLSDDACKEAYRLYQASAWDSRYDDGVGRDCFTGGWQECARRAEGLMDGLSRRIDAVQAENKRLRELLRRNYGILRGLRHTTYSREILEDTRAALEGRE